MSSAIATFFAARKQPRSSIERLMSTSSTVAARVVSSVVDLEVALARGGSAARDRSPRASAFAIVRPMSQVERVAELVVAAPVAALADAAGRAAVVAAERVASIRAKMSSSTFWPIAAGAARRERLSPLRSV